MDVQALNSYAEKFAFQLWDSCTKIDEEPFKVTDYSVPREAYW